MKKVKLSAVALFAAATIYSTHASADNYSFKIENDSGYIISSFQTDEGNGWSKNWLSDDVDSDETRNMHFFKDGPCDIQVRVGWRTTDGGQEYGDPWDVDICKTHTLYFDGDKVTYD